MNNIAKVGIKQQSINQSDHQVIFYNKEKA